ncbi:MAG: hypothetical protein A4S12_09060 [Proteobacteria bacterium SG_bin5]|nr:hypothetical protein [Sphingomonas sp.]OQW41153.1 MAG: hypothetical protein A4S12_09060 [Proteobacteria bacterium SG_bin5]
MKAIRTLALAALTIAGTAHAQSDSNTQTVSIGGSADRICTLGQPQLVAGDVLNFLNQSGGSLQVQTLADPVTLTTRAARVGVTLDAVCNYPHQLRFETANNGLFSTNQNPLAAPTGFGAAVPYTVDAQWNGTSATFFANALLRQRREQVLITGGAFAGAVTLRFTIAAGATNAEANSPLVAGPYGDFVRIWLEPQP